MKQYPAIYKSEDKSIYLYSDKGNYYCFTREFWGESEDMDNHESDTNITREYLQNTWGVIESKEHAEFIVKLAELHGFELGEYEIGKDTHFYTSDDYIGFSPSAKLARNRNEKQITIPLPPKAEANEAGHNLVFASSECKEWPCVGDNVALRYKFDSKQVMHTGKLLYLSDSNIIIEKTGNADYHCHRCDWVIEKPKTPEEALRDEVTEVIWKANEQWGNSKGERQISAQEFLAIALLTKYNITPKEV